MRRIYVMLTKTNTTLARMIRGLTRVEFSHSSLALDDNLDTMCSFGRRKVNNPFVGRFVDESVGEGLLKKFDFTDCMIFTGNIEDAEYDEILAYIDGIRTSEIEYKFNIIGLFYCGLNIVKERKYKRCCSQFVSESLHKVQSIKLPRHYMTMQPNDFRNVEGLTLIYYGPIRDIPLPFDPDNIIAVKDVNLKVAKSKEVK